MPIEIITKDDRNVFEYDDAKIYYRRIPWVERQAIRQKHIRMDGGKEIVDTLGFIKEMCSAMTIGWENILSNGEPIEYTIENLLRLPDNVLIQYAQAINDVDERKELEVKGQRKN